MSIASRRATLSSPSPDALRLPGCVADRSSSLRTSPRSPVVWKVGFYGFARGHVVRFLGFGRQRPRDSSLGSDLGVEETTGVSSGRCGSARRWREEVVGEALRIWGVWGVSCARGGRAGSRGVDNGVALQGWISFDRYRGSDMGHLG
ncbi:hypothetical protein KC19_5G126000 [Ceratodon purpureus]|uniref:Uncharacterized protein n=1 Tax=Ceratodon purpureus TaxID=3225 RepID=A0A8T0I395_CERPU|nr:hypothetical protein KC19_5G126000 [Ceratodon purpureus]